MTDNLPDVIWASAYPYPEWARSESLIKYIVNLSGADGYAKYTRHQPKYKRVDLGLKRESIPIDYKDGSHREWEIHNAAFNEGWNAHIDYIKAKYGDLYVLTKEGE